MYLKDYLSTEEMNLLEKSQLINQEKDYSFEELYNLEHEILEYINEHCVEEAFYKNEEIFDKILDVIMDLENESSEVNPIAIEIHENDHVELTNGKTGMVVDLTNNVYTIEVDEELKTGNIDDDILIVASNSILGLAK